MENLEQENGQVSHCLLPCFRWGNLLIRTVRPELAWVRASLCGRDIILLTQEKNSLTLREALSPHTALLTSLQKPPEWTLSCLFPVPDLDHMPALLREKDADSLSLFLSNEWAITKLFWKLLSSLGPNGAFDSECWEHK